MERQDLRDAIDELYCYFRYKVSASDDQVDIWFKKVKHIPIEALKWIIDRIQELEKLPGNLPMSFGSFYSAWSRTTDQPGDFNPVYDDRFPRYKMHRAVDILEASGEGAFLKYCNDAKMPESDRERCRCKLKAYFNLKEQTDKVGVHLNPGERKWVEKDIPF